jgi:GNAT superfamily N-acetyltransferase
MRPVRVSTSADLDAIVATLTSAFLDDPLWGPAFPDRERRPEQAGALWRLCAGSAQRYGWVRVTDAVESAAVWIPPGGTELTEAEHAGFDDFLVGVCGRETANGILAIFDQLDQHRPLEPHYYLSLLGTHSDHRGGGFGMGLLRESLADIDALGLPAYLESSNPANNRRYASVGFAPRAEFATASGHVVTTMWRTPAG